MLSVKHGRCECRSKVIGLTRLEIKPESTAREGDALSTRPSELLKMKQLCRLQPRYTVDQETFNGAWNREKLFAVFASRRIEVPMSLHM